MAEATEASSRTSQAWKGAASATGLATSSDTAHAPCCSKPAMMADPIAPDSPVTTAILFSRALIAPPPRCAALVHDGGTHPTAQPRSLQHRSSPGEYARA